MQLGINPYQRPVLYYLENRYGRRGYLWDVMNIFTFILFFIFAVISGVIILYLILLGMAPGVKPLDFTGFFLYQPGPGFFLLVGWLFLASILQIYAWAIKKLRQGSKSRLWNRISWAGLVLLLTLEAIMIADFWDFLES